jgi:hypothetical protein
MEERSGFPIPSLAQAQQELYSIDSDSPTKPSSVDACTLRVRACPCFTKHVSKGPCMNANQGDVECLVVVCSFFGAAISDLHVSSATQILHSSIAIQL